ncbi:MAG: response regulator transcription factor [Verrucomicrobiota bacterium]
MKTRILVVEDDANILLGLQEVFRSEGFEVFTCERGDEALDRLAETKPQIILLDVMLPKKNGYEICREIRKAKIQLPVLMLTAKGQEMDKVVGLDCGADDYVTKPFGVRELVARVHALLRRTVESNGPLDAETANGSGRFEMGAAQIDPKRFELVREEKTHRLTAKEFELLRFFHEHPDEVLSRDELLSKVWGYQYFGTTRTLDQMVVQLRKKLGEPTGKPRHLLTVHGVGYRWVP